MYYAVCCMYVVRIVGYVLLCLVLFTLIDCVWFGLMMSGYLSWLCLCWCC